MLRSTLTGFASLMILASLSNAPARAGEYGYGYDYYAPRVYYAVPPAYYAAPPVYYTRSAYYAPPDYYVAWPRSYYYEPRPAYYYHPGPSYPTYGYASPGPAVLIRPHAYRARYWGW